MIERDPDFVPLRYLARSLRKTAKGLTFLTGLGLVTVTLTVVGLYQWGAWKVRGTLPNIQSPYDLPYHEYSTCIEDRHWCGGVGCHLIPEIAKKAVIAAEDPHFYGRTRHIMFEPLASIAHKVARPQSKLRSGATISSMLARQTLWSGERRFAQGIEHLRSFYLTAHIDDTLSKEEILCAYLNSVYFGQGAYGIKEGAWSHFRAALSDITVAEAATLAGILHRPSNYTPSGNPEATLSRRNHVLEKMYQLDFIDALTYEWARHQPLGGYHRPGRMSL